MAVLLAAPVWAQRGSPLGWQHRTQGTSGTTRLGGTVMAGDHAAAGASVELESLATGAVVRTATESDGSFEFMDVQPGEYVITTSLGAAHVRNEIAVANTSSDLHIQIPNAAGPKAGPSVSVSELQVSKKARKAFDDAYKAAQRGDTARASKKLDEALAAAPDFAAARTMRASLRLQDGQVEAALSDAEAAVRADAAYAPGFFVLASVLNRQAQFADAERAANSGLQRAPQAWQGHFELGGALEGQNRHGEALSEFNAAAQSAPANFAGVFLLRAITLIKLRRYPEAQTDLEEVLRREPHGPAASLAQQLSTQLNTAQPSAQASR